MHFLLIVLAMGSRLLVGRICLNINKIFNLYFREVVKTAKLVQDQPNHKIDGGLCLHSPSLTSKDGVFIA